VSISPVIKNNIVSYNIAATDGGGIFSYKASPVIIDNYFCGNTAGSIGGAIHCYQSFLFINGNTIVENTVSGPGGGISCYNSSAEIANNIIQMNISTDSSGGGIYCSATTATIYNNIVINNTADRHGGGLSIINSSAIITNNIIGNNSSEDGGGVYLWKQSPLIINNTITDNSASEHGGGVCCRGSYPVIINSILWNNDAFSGPEIYLGDSNYPSNIFITYSNVQGNQSSVFIEPGSGIYWGFSILNADPLFVDQATSDYHLTFNSPCKDTGDNTALTDLFDFESDPRIAYGTVDMGADEFHPHLYYTGNPTPGGNIDLKLIGIPEDTVRLWIGSGVLDPPLHHSIYGNWYLETPILLGLILGTIPSPDGVSKMSVDIPFDFVPCDIPLQAGIGFQLSNLCVLEVE